jgi:hypothetical protein
MGDFTPNPDQSTYANHINGEHGSEMEPMPNSWRRSSPLPPSEFRSRWIRFANLDNTMLPTVSNSQHLDCTGNWVSHLDAAYTRIANQYKNKSAGDSGRTV